MLDWGEFLSKEMLSRDSFITFILYLKIEIKFLDASCYSCFSFFIDIDIYKIENNAFYWKLVDDSEIKNKPNKIREKISAVIQIQLNLYWKTENVFQCASM